MPFPRKNVASIPLTGEDRNHRALCTGGLRPTQPNRGEVGRILCSGAGRGDSLPLLRESPVAHDSKSDTQNEWDQSGGRGFRYSVETYIIKRSLFENGRSVY